MEWWKVRYEEQEASARKVLLAGGAFLLGTAILHIVSYGIWRAWWENDKTPDPAPFEVPPDVPEQEVVPSTSRAAIEGMQRQLLSSYGWVDEDAGVARIPIERAMAILAEGE